jgi:hypothetical protein
MGHAPGLWVSERGEVVCSEHAPYNGSDTWRWDHFIQITEVVERIWMEDGAARPRCENCGKTREEAERE